jgi:hypothetical protein
MGMHPPLEADIRSESFGSLYEDDIDVESKNLY